MFGTQSVCLTCMPDPNRLAKSLPPPQSSRWLPFPATRHYRPSVFRAPLGRRAAQVFIVATLSFASLWAQGSATGGDQGQPRTPLPGAQPSQAEGQPQQASLELLRNAYFGGRVAFQDGTPAQEPIAVEMTCNGRAIPVGFTNLKGEFGFRLGDRPGEVTGDASVAGVPGGPQGGPIGTLANDGFDAVRMNSGFGGLSGRTAHRPGTVDLSGCDLAARLPGFSSSRLYLGRRSAGGDSNLGTLVLSRLQPIDGAAVSATTLAAPPKARRSFAKAIAAMRQEEAEPRKALQSLEQAVRQYPEYAAAWSMLGQLRLNSGDIGQARQAFKRSIEADSRYLKPYMPLIRLHLGRSDWQEAARLAETLARLDPYLTDARYCHAFASFNLKNLEAAERSLLAVRAASDAARFPQMHRMLAFIHLQRRDFPKAAEEMRAFAAAVPEDPQAIAIQRKLQEWTSMGVIPPTPPAATP